MVCKQVYNFSAGPAMLPQEVLKQVQEELLDYRGTGFSLMTISHRSQIFLEVLHELRCDLTKLIDLPNDYTMLCLQSGASLQFFDVALNLSMTQHRRIGCVISGNWSRLAYQQMKKMKYFEVFAVASSEDKQGRFLETPPQKSWQLPKSLDFIHFASNETAHGVQFRTLPYSRDKDYPPLVCDMSSDIFSRPIQVNDYGVIYASAQKNIGGPGVTLLLIRDDLLHLVDPHVPDVLAYEAYWKKDGMYNTPNTFGIYVCDLVIKWLLKQGGIATIAQHNQQKADLLYHTIDHSGGFYCNNIKPDHRSLMNVVFHSPSAQLDKCFVQEAKANGLWFLEGYKSLGGMRARIYNAMSIQGVKALCAFMQDFQKKYG